MRRQSILAFAAVALFVTGPWACERGFGDPTATFQPGDLFVGTLDESGDNNEIYQIRPDGTISTFVSNISGGIRALAFDPSHESLYALTIRGGGDPIRQIIRFNNNGQRQLFADFGLHSEIPAGETDMEVAPDGRILVTTGSNDVVEVLPSGSVSRVYEGGTYDVFHALEVSGNNTVFLGERGGDVFIADLALGTSAIVTHVPMSHPDIDFQGVEATTAGDLIALIQDFSQDHNLFRISQTGVTTPFARIDNQGGKLAVGPTDMVFAVALNEIDVFGPDGSLLDSFAFSRQLDGIAVAQDITPVPAPGAVLLGAMGLLYSGWRLRRQRTEGGLG
jgi:hypothetical protein